MLQGNNLSRTVLIMSIYCISIKRAICCRCRKSISLNKVGSGFELKHEKKRVSLVTPMIHVQLFPYSLSVPL